MCRDSSLGSPEDGGTAAPLMMHICRTARLQLSADQGSEPQGGGRRKDLAQARDGIGELFGRVAAIRHQAEASEAMVQDICRDIRKLDHAKSHLTATITAFRRLSMLVTAVGATPDLMTADFCWPGHPSRRLSMLIVAIGRTPWPVTLTYDPMTARVCRPGNECACDASAARAVTTIQREPPQVFLGSARHRPAACRLKVVSWVQRWCLRSPSCTDQLQPRSKVVFCIPRSCLGSPSLHLGVQISCSGRWSATSMRSARS